MTADEALIYTIQKASSSSKEIALLKNNWLASLTAPQDDMWESFRNQAIHWTISHTGQVIGYACIDDNNQLLQFYVVPNYVAQEENIFKELIYQTGIKQGIVGTNNPSYLSVALNFAKKIHVHTCLFRDYYETNISEKKGHLKACQLADQEQIVDFCHNAMGAPKVWLTQYIGDLIKKKEIYVFERNQDIIGTCEIRKSISNPTVADIGMIVSPDHRRKGYGTYLLNCARKIAIDWGKQAICSCEKENIGSLKAIQNCGFVSRFQLLAIDFLL